MSVQLHPINQLSFNRPLYAITRSTLTITNHNAQPVVFKIKTTAPKPYSVRPNLGTIDPGQSVDVQILLQAMQEPTLPLKCKDKFLVQSMIIRPDQLSKSASDIWVFDGNTKAARIHQQKISVVYLPPKEIERYVGNESDSEEELDGNHIVNRGLDSCTPRLEIQTHCLFIASSCEPQHDHRLYHMTRALSLDVLKFFKLY